MSEKEKISDILDILYSMKEDIRMKIFDIVFSSGEEGTSFKTIVEEGNIPPTTAAYHLKVLTRSKIVEKRFRNIDGRRDYSFYSCTNLGERAYFLINEIFKDLDRDEENEGEELPDIMVIPLRYGPRCISVERTTG